MKKILKIILITLVCLWIYQMYFRYVIDYSGGMVLIVDRLTGKGYELSRLDGLFPYPYCSKKNIPIISPILGGKK